MSNTLIKHKNTVKPLNGLIHKLYRFKVDILSICKKS